MRFEIKNDHGHYTLYVDGMFYGSYDKFSEAADDVEMLKKEMEVA